MLSRTTHTKEELAGYLRAKAAFRARLGRVNGRWPTPYQLRLRSEREFGQQHDETRLWLLDQVKYDLIEWSGFRHGRLSQTDRILEALDASERCDVARAIETPQDAARFYLETVTGEGWAGLSLRERWHKLYRLYRMHCSGMLHEVDGISDTQRRIVHLLVTD